MLSWFFGRKAPVRRYGWKRDLHDPDDHMLRFSSPSSLPNKIDLRNKFPPVWNQETLGCCTAESVSGAYMYDFMKEIQNQFTPSVLFLYYNTRVIEHTQDSDSGATIRDTVKSIAQSGICPDDIWPFDPNKFNVKPPVSAYTSAQQHKVLKYSRLRQEEAQIEGALAEGYPVCFGIMVYSSFESRRTTETGEVSIPESNKESLLGGHAIVMVGYDKEKRVFIFRNSWGSDWGDKGYGYIPYDYVLDKSLASDFWVLQTVD